MHSVESNNAIFTLKQEPSKIHISNGMKYDLVTEKKNDLIPEFQDLSGPKIISTVY
jgi:hypothetical protein